MFEGLKINHLNSNMGGCRPKNLNLPRTHELASLGCLLCVRRFYEYMARRGILAKGLRVANLTTSRTVREVAFFNGTTFKSLKYEGLDIEYFKPSYYHFTALEVDSLTWSNNAILDKKLKFLKESVRRYNIYSDYKISLRASEVSIPLRFGAKPQNIEGIAIITNLGSVMAKAFIFLHLNAAKTLISAFEDAKLENSEYEAYMLRNMDSHIQQIYDNSQYTRRWYMRPLARVIGSYGLLKFYQELDTNPTELNLLTERKAREESLYWAKLPLGYYPYSRTSGGFRAEFRMNKYA